LEKIFTKWIPALWDILSKYLTWENIKDFFTSENIFYRMFWDYFYPFITSPEFWDGLIKAGKTVLKGIWDLFDWLMGQLWGKWWETVKETSFDVWQTLLEWWESTREVLIKVGEPFSDFIENMMGYWSEIKVLGGFKEWIFYQIYSYLKEKGFDTLAGYFKTEEIEKYEKLQLSIKENKKETEINGEPKWSPKYAKTYEDAKTIYENEREKFVEKEYYKMQSKTKPGEKPLTKPEIRSIYEKENPYPNESDYFDNTSYTINEVSVNNQKTVNEHQKIENVLEEMDVYIKKIKDPDLTPEEYDKISQRVEEINNSYIHGLGETRETVKLSDKITEFNIAYSGNKYTKQQYSAVNNETNKNVLNQMDVNNKTQVSNINKTDTTVVKENKTIVSQNEKEPKKPMDTDAQTALLAELTANLYKRVENLKKPIITEGLLGTKHQF